MAYKALKPVKFSRLYLIGEYIPGSEVEPGRAAAICQMGLIERVNDDEEAVERTIDTAKKDDVNANLSPTAGEDATECETVAPLTKTQLRSRTKTALLELAAGIGLGLTEELTKDQLIEAILLKQER